MPKVTPFFWYNGQVRDAVELYTSVFPDARVLSTSPGPNGSVMAATIEIEGQQFTLFDGGPTYTLSPAVSLSVKCETQEEVDRLWARLSDGGSESRCGWLVDRFGLSWQIMPSRLQSLLQHPDRATAKRVREAMMGMKKLDIAALERAASAAA